MTLVAFDFDGTLTGMDVTELLGREYGVAGEIRGLAEQGARGEIDFESSLRQRAALLEGMPEREMEAAFERCKLRDSAAELIADLRQSGADIAIVTGSFRGGVEAALDRARVAVDYLVANELLLENGAVTGDIEGPLVAAEKDRALGELAAAEGYDLQETIAIGNGSRDLPMLRTAGTAIGFRPEPLVEEHSDTVVTSIRELRLYFEQHGIVETDERSD